MVARAQGPRCFDNGNWSSATAAEYDSFFYAPCERCDGYIQTQNRASNTQIGTEESLCLHCQHLRLRHLFACTVESNILPGLEIWIGTYNDIKSRQQIRPCKFCSLVCSAVHTIIESAHHFIDSSKEDMVKIRRRLGRVEINYAPTGSDLTMHISIQPSWSWLWRWLKGDKGLGENQAGLYIPWHKVRQWMAECDSQHKDTGLEYRTTEPLPPGFVVIDVRAGCLVDAPPDCRFVALSYVWGALRPGELVSKASNRERLREPGTLTREALPATLWDAMTACQEIGIRYIWIDRLCIEQDGGVQKVKQIAAMDVIYSRAALTICATGSADSHAGLRGSIDTPRSVSQGYAEFDGMEMIVALPDDRFWRLGLKWWERAWTYQEYALSPKKLLLSPWQACFECEHMDVKFEGQTRSAGITLESQARQLHDASHLERYRKVVEDYNTRVVTSPFDMLYGFQGVFKSIYGSLDQFVHGLPAADFDLALLWDVETLSTADLCRSPDLPSWSWACVKGRIKEDPICSFIASVARWNTWDQHYGHRPILAKGTNDGALDRSFSPIHAWAAWASGCIETPLPPDLQAPSDFSLLQEKLLRRWPTYEHYWLDAFATSGPWLCDDSAQIALAQAKEGRIMLRTTIQTLRVDDRKNLLTPDGSAVGFLQDFVAFAPNKASFPGREWDFVALSTASAALEAGSHRDLCKFSEPVGDAKPFFGTASE